MEIASVGLVTECSVVPGPTRRCKEYPLPPGLDPSPWLRQLSARRRMQILWTAPADVFHASVHSYARHRSSRSTPTDPASAHGRRVRIAGRPAPARMVRCLRSSRPIPGLRWWHRQSLGRSLAGNRPRGAVRRLAPPKPQAYPARRWPEPAPARLCTRRQAAHAPARLPLVARPAPRSILARPATGRLPARAGPRRTGHRRPHHQRRRAAALRSRTAALPRGGCAWARHVGRTREGEALWRVLLPARPSDGTGLLPTETARAEDPRAGGELPLSGGYRHVAPERTRRRCADAALRLENQPLRRRQCPPLRTLRGVRPRARPISHRPGCRSQRVDLRRRAAAGS